MSKSIKTYYSKIEEGLIVAIVLGMIPVIAITLSQADNYVVPIGIIAIICLILIFYMRPEKYTIHEHTRTLETKSIFSHKKIAIDSIISIKKHTAILSTPTLSFNTIAIESSAYPKLIISPKDQKEFVRHLIQVNTDIRTDIRI